MTARRNAWITHAILTSALLVAAGIWALLLARDDHDGWHIGRAIGILLFGATVLYALLATGAVAIWGRRPVAVLGLHALCAAVTVALLLGTCVRV